MIESKGLSAQINDKGAELYSLKKGGMEHIWQGDPRFWADRAPLLFPIIGRQMEDKITVDGADYPMFLHGFAKDGLFTLVSKSEDRLELKLKSSEKTLAQYPFNFELTSVYSLSGSALTVTRRVKNLGSAAMPFCIGEHFGIMTPLSAKIKYNDYYLRLERRETAARHILNERHYVDGTKPFLDNDDIIKLTDTLFKDDALVFCGLKSKSVTLENGSGHRVRVSFADYANLAFWARPGAAFVCVEPWNGIDSREGDTTDIFQKDGVLVLAPGEQRGFSCAIEIL